MKHYQTVSFIVDGEDLLKAELRFCDLVADLRDVFGPDNVVTGPGGEVTIEVIEEPCWQALL